MATFTLDDIKAAAEAQYGSLDIQLPDREVKLLNPLRLSGEKRKALSDVQRKLDELQSAASSEDDLPEERDIITEQEALLDQMFRLTADTEAGADALLAHINDLALKMVVLDEYGKGTQVGEASSSQS